MKLAVLDDYQGTANDLGDWGQLTPGTEVEFFQDHITDEAALVNRLKDFDMVMEEFNIRSGSQLAPIAQVLGCALVII